MWRIYHQPHLLMIRLAIESPRDNWKSKYFQSLFIGVNKQYVSIVLYCIYLHSACEVINSEQAIRMPTIFEAVKVLIYNFWEFISATCTFTRLTPTGLMPNEGLRQFLYYAYSRLQYKIHVNTSENIFMTEPHQCLFNSSTGVL